MISLNTKILLIITGGIASYKALDLIRRLQENDVTIECILTENAKKFINLITFESLLGKKFIQTFSPFRGKGNESYQIS